MSWCRQSGGFLQRRSAWRLIVNFPLCWSSLRHFSCPLSKDKHYKDANFTQSSQCMEEKSTPGGFSRIKTFLYWGNLKRIVLCTFDLTDLLRSLNNPWVWRKEYWAWPQVREFHEFLIASFRGITYSYTLKENLVLVKKQKLLPLDLRTLELMVSALKSFKQEGTNSILTYDFLCFYHSISDCRAETGWSNQKTPNTLCGAQHSILLLLSSLFLLSIIKSDTIIDFTTR